MNPMMAAIKKRKSGGQTLMGDHEASHMSAHDEGDGQPKSGKDLHGLVASLSPHEKSSLKTILDKDSGSAAQAIAKGGPSTEEQGKIAEASAKEDQQNQAEANEDLLEASPGSVPGVTDDQHDDIGKSMLDSSHLRGTNPMNKPRNLGERVKQSIANKLKSKGKI